MRKCINKTLNNEFKKPSLTKVFTKDDIVSPQISQENNSKKYS